MTIMKTKDVSEFLGISQTNIKRWASHYPHYFNKNQLGHYVFTEQEVNMLLYIKNEVSQGHALPQIPLPVIPVSLPLHEPSISNKPYVDQPMDEVLSRIREVERSLQNKADDVVSTQVLHHRAELEELRKMIEQIAVSVEKMQKPGVDRFTFNEGTSASSSSAPRPLPSVTAQKPASSGNAQQPSTPVKKRGFFRSFF